MTLLSKMATTCVGLWLLSGCTSAIVGLGDVTTPALITSLTSSDVSEDEQASLEEFAVDDSSRPQLGDAGLCTTEGINAWVDAQMRDYYIYANQVPVVNPNDYDDASALLAELRVAPDIYSTIGPQASRAALFEEGATFGFGFRWRRDPFGALRFVNIVSGSPLYDANALRGDRIIALNGIPELNVSDAVFDEIFGEQGVPTTVTFTIERDGITQDITVTSNAYVINTVANVQSFNHNGATIGYIESSVFLRTSEAELDSAVTQLIAENPSDVILDFRYNSGGFVFIAQKLAAQLAGSNFAGEVFQNTEFNETYTSFNQTSQLEAQELNLNLPRIIVLTTSSTASASEAIANNLSPYLDVVVIGTRTAGKPFASVGNENCNQVLNAMDRITSNKNGNTVLGGITPTCVVNDEYNYAMFDPNDALFGAALSYLSTNACPIEPIAASQSETRNVLFKAAIDSYRDIHMPTAMMIQ